MKLTQSRRTMFATIVAVVLSLPAAAVAPNAKDILVKMDAVLKQSLTTGKSYQATITRSAKKVGDSGVAQLRLKLIPGKKVRAELSMKGKGAAQTILAVDDGTTTTVYMVSKKNAMKQPSNIKGSTMMLASMSGLPLNVIANLRVTTATITGSTSVGGKPAYVIAVKASKPGFGGIWPTQYTIDKATYRLRKVVSDAAGTRITLTISDEIVDKPIAASAFKLNIPAGVKVSDMRAGAKPAGPVRRK